MSSELKSNNHQNNIKRAKPSDSTVYEFEDFRLDAENLMLYRCSGEEISLTPKQVETLFALVEKSGEIVSKNALMDRLWANAFVEESNLIQNIYILRKILGVTSGGKPMIETLRRRGYRFNGVLKENEQTQPVIVSEEQPEEAAALLKLSSAVSNKAVSEKADAVDSPDRSRIIAALVVVVLLVGSIALGYYFYAPKNTSVGDKKSIAILPLKPINAANRDEIYEVGIADSLIYRLGSMKGFVVRPLSAIRKYTDIEQDPIAAGREQRVDYVLASNYQLADGKIRVTSQLFNVANGQIEETYQSSEKGVANVFAMQDAIAEEVGNKLQARFATTSSSPKAVRGTTNEEAYRLYLQGMYLYNKRNLESARKAVEALEQAVRLDANYALAWAGKAYAHRLISNFLGRGANIQDEYQKSIEAVNKALALDANLSEGYSALCENKFLYEWDFAGAESACRRAIELNPESSMGHQIYSRFLMGRGRFDEAIVEIKTAIDLEPTALYNQRLYGNCLLNARRYDEAVAQFKRVLAMDDSFSTTYEWLSVVLALQGKESEAFEWFIKSLAYKSRFHNIDEETIRAFQTAYQTSGWQGVVYEQANRFEKGKEIYFNGAIYNAQIGNKDKSFEYLEKSFERREWGIHILQVDPRLDALRDDPRFDELVRRVGSN
jgi:DNA-binding winged helix-turn-helix (wHTH) protein/TolB-like protein/Tfp pilus assembly protein PilF